MYLTAVICSCEGGLDAHANTERGSILSFRRRDVGWLPSRRQPLPYRITEGLPVTRPQSCNFPEPDNQERHLWSHSQMLWITASGRPRFPSALPLYATLPAC